MNNFTDIRNKDTVKLAPWLLNSKYKENILNVLKSRYEGICSKFGYIKTNSITLLSVNKGSVEMSTFHGYVLFDVEFMSSICNPAIGSIVKCQVKNINVFGILCTSGIVENGVYQNILNIIIPKQHSQFMNSNDAILDNVVVNDEVNVEILGKKYILNNKNINVFGKLIESVKTNTILDTDNDYNSLDLEDDADLNEESVMDDDVNDENDENDDDEKTENNSVVLSDIEVDEDNDIGLSENDLSDNDDFY